ncbi:MAG: hypothetical protein FWD23_16020, partial [Oscillospiraceae bacterium]|nr:hypothetical protein [Oscillospiraceae bacterium]
LVADLSDPEHRDQLEVAKSLLFEMGITEKPIVTIYNKADMAAMADMEQEVPGVYISALTGEGTDGLLAEIQTVLESLRKPAVFVFPADQKSRGDIAYLYKNAAVSNVEYGDAFVTVWASADEKTRNMYKEYLTR